MHLLLSLPIGSFSKGSDFLLGPLESKKRRHPVRFKIRLKSDANALLPIRNAIESRLFKDRDDDRESDLCKKLAWLLLRQPRQS